MIKENTLMINNNICLHCSKSFVCKIRDILAKFEEDAKKPLGLDLTIDSCHHFEIDELPEDKNSDGEDESK
jgi:hypothetical protein